MTPKIRWKKRLHHWAGFFNTSKSPIAIVRRVSAYCGYKVAWDFSSIQQAKDWCEAQLAIALLPYPVSEPCWFIWANGKVEQHAVEPNQSKMLVQFLPHCRLELLQEHALENLPIGTLLFERKRWRHDLVVMGIRHRLEISLFVESGADQLADTFARDWLRQEKMRLTEAVFRTASL